MEKQEYIVKVSKFLICSKAQKIKIIEDLEEIFNSATENNKNINSVIDGLGSPKEYAISSMLALGVDIKEKKRKRMMLILACFFISIFNVATSIFINSNKLPSNAIGQADALTQIQVATSFDFTTVILFIGTTFFAIAIIGAIKLYKMRG